MLATKETAINEKIEILKSCKENNVINVKRADEVSSAWKYAAKSHCC